MDEYRDDTTIYSLDEIRSVVLPYIRERGFKWARLFGSYARGEANGSSDIDILVDKGDARAIAVYGLSTVIQMALGKDADVFDIREVVPGSFRDSVLRESVVL